MPETNQIQLSMEANGSSIKAEVGTNIRVSLQSNATTGYKWEIDTIDENITQCIQSGFNNSNATAPGSAGQQYFEFMILKKGSCNISLKYYRSWQGDASIIKKFDVTVNVI